MKKTIKRIFYLTACIFLIILTFSACSSDGAISISGAQVSKGVYAYYLDKVLSYPEEYSLKDFTKKEAIAKACELCEKHIAISSICTQWDFKLSTISKSEVASEVENRYSFFGDYYSSIGVSKQDFQCVTENAAKRALIIESLYGSNGKKPVSNYYLIKAFNERYVGFKAITGYLTKINEDGTQGNYTSAEIKEIYSDFEDMAEEINNGNDIDTLNKRYNESQGLTGPDKLTTIVLDESDTTYADGFYKKVKSIKQGDAAVVKSDKYVYVILREDISSSTYISQYKNDLLEYLKSDDIEKLLIAWCNNHGKVKRSGLSGIYKTVSAMHKDEFTSASEAVTTKA